MKKSHKTFFTLLELMLAMGVFALLMLMIIRIYAQINEIYAISMARIETFEKGNFILDMMSRDLRNACPAPDYNRSFYFPRTGVVHNNDSTMMFLAFSASTRFRPSMNSISRICEVAYFLDVERGRLYYRLIGDAMRDGCTQRATKNGLLPSSTVAFDFLSDKYKTSGNPFKEELDDSLTNLREQIWAPDREVAPDYNSNEGPEGRFVLMADGIYWIRVEPYNVSRSKPLQRRGDGYFKNFNTEVNCRLEFVDYFQDPIMDINNRTLEFASSEGLFPIPDVMTIEICVIPSDTWTEIMTLSEIELNVTTEEAHDEIQARMYELINNSIQTFRRFVSNICIPKRGEFNDDCTNKSDYAPIPSEI